MSNILKSNAYQILGIDLTTSEKDILKRSKEILNRLKIDDIPEYDSDIEIFDNFRNEESVKEAIQKLQSPKKQIIEFFFWFYISDDIDKKALKHIKDKDYQSAIEIWGKDYKEDTVISFNHKKNLALFLIYLLSIEDNEDCVEKSISLWKSIFDSEKYWSSFKKVYSLYNEQSLDDSRLAKFKTEAVGYLGDIYTEFYEKYKNDIYIEKFEKTFSSKSDKIQDKILNPAFEKINNTIEELENMNISKDGVVDQQEKEKLKKLINMIQVELNSLIDLGLYDDSQTKVMRDKAANIIRNISVDLNNNLDESEIALGLGKIAEKIAGMESTKSKIQTDVDTFQKNVEYKTKGEKFNQIIEPILEKIKSGNSQKALEEINALINDDKIDIETKKSLQEFKQTLEERIVTYGKPIEKAPSLYTINGCGSKIYGDTLYFVLLFIPIFPIARYSLTDNGNGTYNFLGKLELTEKQKFWKYTFIVIVSVWILVQMSKG